MPGTWLARRGLNDIMAGETSGHYSLGTLSLLAANNPDEIRISHSSTWSWTPPLPTHDISFPSTMRTLSNSTNSATHNVCSDEASCFNTFKNANNSVIKIDGAPEPSRCQ